MAQWVCVGLLLGCNIQCIQGDDEMVHGMKQGQSRKRISACCLRSSVPALLAAVLMCLSLPAMAAALQPGDQAPTFAVAASLDGEQFDFSLQEALDEWPVVVYFFPSAFTQGCDIEAHTFAEQKADFTAAGASIIGVSADSIERLHAFSQDPDFCAGQFPVASDPQGEVAQRYGLPMTQASGDVRDINGDLIEHGFFPRTTFVINAGGDIVATLSSRSDDLSPTEHVERSLEIVRELEQADD